MKQTLIAVLVAAAATAATDPTFMRMWNEAQQKKPARITSSERIATATEPGTPFLVQGRVIDPAGRPVSAVEVFAYHTDATGLYAAAGAADPWRLKGWALTDMQGRFEFRTIRPAPYPNRDIPAHIHLSLVTSCCGRQFAELMFEDDALATPAYRERFARAGEHGFYASVRPGISGQTVSYTIQLRRSGDF